MTMPETPLVPAFSEPYPSYLSPDTFAEAAERVAQEWPGVIAAQNEQAQFVNARAQFSAEQAQLAGASSESALSSAHLAAAHANFKGRYSDLLGALAKPASVLFNGRQWILLKDLADVTAVAPGTDAEYWWDYTGSIIGEEGAGGWLGPAIDIEAADIGTAPTGSIYFFAGEHGAAVAQGLPNLGVDPVTPVHWVVLTMGSASRAVQDATQILEIEGFTGAKRTRVNVDSAWAEWTIIGAGGEDGAEIGLLNWIDHGNVAVTGSETVSVDFSLGLRHLLSMQASNTTGSLTLNLQNIPAPAFDSVTMNLLIRFAGRKPISITAPGHSVNYAQGAAPTYNNAAGSYDVLDIFKKPGSTQLDVMVVRSGVY